MILFIRFRKRPILCTGQIHRLVYILNVSKTKWNKSCFPFLGTGGRMVMELNSKAIRGAMIVGVITYLDH